MKTSSSKDWQFWASVVLAVIGIVAIARLQGPEILLQYGRWREAGSWLSNAETTARNAGLLQALGSERGAHDLARRSILQEQYNPRALAVFRQSGPTADANEEARYADVVARLGWRDEDIDKVVLQRAIAIGDYSAAMQRASALLTQRELASDVLDLLIAFEQDRDARIYLWRELARNPVWFYDFLQSGNLADAATREARAKTLRWLLTRGKGLERRGLSPAMFAFLEAGQTSRAMDLWRAYAGKPGHGGLYDPDFAGLLRRPVTAGSSPLPFEWNLTQAPGHTVTMPSPEEGGEGLRISWDGRGTPVFAWQQLELGKGERIRIKLISDGTSAKMASKLRIEMACPPAQGVAFPTLSRGVAEISRAQIPCDYPVLRVMGGNQGFPQPVDGSLMGVRVDTY